MSGTENKPSSKYWAFVSYSHFDMRVAKWLTAALAKRRVPPAYRHIIEGSPTNFAPLFRDEVEVSASSRLDASIEAALRQSKNLIVICSPFAVASEYVAQEIRYFISLGRADRILCLVASGEPNATDEGQAAVECFPKPLRFRVDESGAQTEDPVPRANRPLAAVLGEESKAQQERALRQITAGLLGVSQSTFDDLMGQRERLRRTLLGAAGVGVLLAGFLFWDAFYREHATYYREFTRRWGAWEGVGAISAGEARHRSESFKFITRGWGAKPSEIQVVKGSGRCSGDGLRSITGDSAGNTCNSFMTRFGMSSSASRACIVRLKYNADGTIALEEKLDQFGKLLETLQYTGPNVATFVEAQFPCETGRGKSGIAFVQFDRIESGPLAGIDKAIYFLGNDRTPRANENGEYGATFTYNDAGWTTSQVVLGQDGKKIGRNRYNIAKYNFTVNDSGDVERTDYENADGTPAVSTSGLSGRRSKYDAWGNEIERMFLVAGKEKPLVSDGHAGWQATYDDNGNNTTLTYVDARGDPTAINSGYVSSVARFDESGNQIELKYVDANNNPAMHRDGNAGWTSTFDGRGNEIERVYVGPDGKTPILFAEGKAGWKSKFDARGNETDRDWIGTAGTRVALSNGVASQHLEFDENNNPVRLTFKGLDRNPILTNKKISGVAAQFDRKRNVLEMSFLAGDDLGLRDDNVAGYWLKVDEQGRPVEKTFFGIDRTPAPSRDGCTILLSSFDERGNENRQDCLDKDRHPVLHKDGYSHWEAKYNDAGKMIEQAYFDPERRVQISAGYSIVRRVFDPRGREIETEFRVTDTLLIRNKDGVARMVIERDDLGNARKYEYWGPDNKRTLDNRGAGGWLGKYDARGRLIEKTYLGLGATATAIAAGFSKERFAYDTRGNTLRTDFLLDADDNPVVVKGETHASIVSTYDAHSNETSREYLDAGGNPVLTSFGAARWVATYDMRDRQTRIEYRDAKGNKVVTKAGYFAIARAFDDRHNETEVTYLGTNNLPTRAKDGMVGWTAMFDQRGNRTERSYFGLERKAEALEGGIAIARSSYDLRNNRTQTRTYALDGITRIAAPYWGWNAVFDTRNRETERTFVDVRGNPTINPSSGCATVKSAYDGRGNVSELSCFGTEGQKTQSNGGFHKFRNEINERDQVVATGYFDETDRKVQPKDR